MTSHPMTPHNHHLKAIVPLLEHTCNMVTHLQLQAPALLSLFCCCVWKVSKWLVDVMMFVVYLSIFLSNWPASQWLRCRRCEPD